jgi:hypothetical protein
MTVRTSKSIRVNGPIPRSISQQSDYQTSKSKKETVTNNQSKVASRNITSQSSVYISNSNVSLAGSLSSDKKRPAGRKQVDSAIRRGRARLSSAAASLYCTGGVFVDQEWAEQLRHSTEASRDDEPYMVQNAYIQAARISRTAPSRHSADGLPGTSQGQMQSAGAGGRGNWMRRRSEGFGRFGAPGKLSVGHGWPGQPSSRGPSAWTPAPISESSPGWAGGMQPPAHGALGPNAVWAGDIFGSQGAPRICRGLCRLRCALGRRW